MKNSQTFTAIVCVSICSVLLVYAWLDLRHQFSAALTARSNAEQCAALGREITKIQFEPKVASLQDRSDDEITKLVEFAAIARGVSEKQILQIAPEALRRINDSYQSRSTRVEIGSASLKRIVEFLAEIESNHPELTVTSLRLIDTGANGSEENWKAEIKIEDLVFSPR